MSRFSKSHLLVAAFAVAVLVWQAAQLWSTGMLGLPGVLQIPLGGDALVTGGVTTIEKLNRTTIAKSDREEEPEQEIAEIAPPPEVETAPPDRPAIKEPPQVVQKPVPPAQKPEPKPTTKDQDKLLPWHVPPAGKEQPDGRVARLPPDMTAPPSAPAPSGPMPSEAELRGWIRSAAQEFVGGVDAEGIPLYRFEVWLAAPDAVKRRIASVTYSYDAPSATPKSQSSSDKSSGFRVRFGGASCARTVAVKVSFEQGESQMTEVDGCAILN